MSIVTAIDRGNVVEFTATFLDAAGATIEPDSASVTVNFLNADDERESATVEMTMSTDQSWFASWSTADAKPALVYWSVKSVGPESAEDDKFMLKGNLANLSDLEA